MVPLRAFSKLALVAVVCSYTVFAQEQGKQASAGPISDFLSTVRAPKIGYAPGIHQAVANTGAQPNPANLFPGLGNPSGNGQNPLQPFTGLAQAGQNALTGFVQASGQLFSAALQPFHQLAQALFKPLSGTTTDPTKVHGGQELFGDIGSRVGNLTGLHTGGKQVESNIIPKTKA